MPRIVDPDRFILLARIVDWVGVQRRHKHEQSASQLARARHITTRVAQLRWLVHPDLGYPTEPFRVWRRPSAPMLLEKPITPTVLNTPFGWNLISWDEPQLWVHARFQVTGGAFVVAYAGAPLSSAIVGIESLSAGIQHVRFSGSAIQCLAVVGNAVLQSIEGMTGGAADDESWVLVEIVGLPVDRRDWNGVFDLDQLQGPAGSLMEPADAALDRFRRGAPLYGWESQVEPGFAAPVWSLANPDPIVKSMQDDMLRPLRRMITSLPPNRHARFEQQRDLPLAGGGPDASTSFHPMNTLLFAAGTDPLASLISGFGTGLDDIDLPAQKVGDTVFFNDPKHGDADYMVTARYSRGADGRSDPVEYAAIVWGPTMATDPPKPANLGVTTEGHTAPASLDGAWRGVMRCAWDKVPDLLPFRIGSYAFARKQQAPAGPVVPLMGERPNDTALQPISATTSVEQEQQTGRLRALDETYEISGSPASNSLRYALAHQDLFSMWSPWSVTGHSIGEPPVQTVSILSARLDVSTPAGGSVCPATLVVELSWDWSSRSPLNLDLVGRLYAQAKRDNPPANVSVPAGLQKVFPGAAGSHFLLTFSGGNTGTPDAGGSVEYVTSDGKTVQGTPVISSGPRRYRLTISGFQLDFASTGHVGLALWARGRENRAPQRVGPWSTEPVIASASDPRPPVLTPEHEDVLMASMADASGEHHLRLTWPSVAGAVGYFIYTATETKVRVDHGMTDPLPGQTLSERLVDLRDAFESSPMRRSFTRINDTPIADTSAQLTIPRGSKEIHLYLVLGVSAGQVESAWPAPGEPNLRKRPAAYAAPQVAAPSRPVLEVSRVLDRSVVPNVYRAAVRVSTRPGAVATRIDVFRTRVSEASVTLDTMGPPIASVDATAPPWVVTPTVSAGPGEAQPLGTVEGVDSPDGSWKRVYYRAVAWSDDQPAKGIYRGRSPASAAQNVIVPPPGPPNLSPIVSGWPGGPLADILLTVTSTEPIEPTPLGPHRIKVEVLAVEPDDSLTPLFSYPQPDANGKLADRLIDVPSIEPVPPSGGIWRQAGPGAGTTTYHVLVKRSSVNQALKARILLTDPIGRTTERTLDVAAGSPLPPPVIDLPVVTKVPGKGFQFGFQTTSPVQPTPLGPYVLRVGFVPGTITVLRGRRLTASSAAGVQVALNEIPLLRRGEDPFASTEPIPVRRERTVRGSTPIAVYLRGTSGMLSLEMEAPDGRRVSLRRTLR